MAVVARRWRARAPSPELVDGPGREPVAAGLVPGEGLALQHAHVVAGLRQPEPRGGPRRPPTHHEDVVPLCGHRLGQPPSSPRRRRPPGRSAPAPAARHRGPALRPASSRRWRPRTARCTAGCPATHLACELALVQHDLAISWSVSWPPNDGIVPPPPTCLLFAVGGGRPSVRAELHPHHVVSPVRPGLHHGTVDERGRRHALPARAVAGGAVGTEQSRAQHQRIGLAGGRWLEGADVDVAPYRQRRQHRHGPVGDALAGLGRLDGGLGLGGRRPRLLHRCGGRRRGVAAAAAGHGCRPGGCRVLDLTSAGAASRRLAALQAQGGPTLASA